MQESSMLRKFNLPGNNYNIYVGSIEYMMNKYLQFKTIQTEDRFIKNLMIRFKILHMALAYFSLFLFLFLASLSLKNIISIICLFPSISTIILRNRINFSRKIERLIYAIEEFLFFLAMNQKECPINTCFISIIIDYIYNISYCIPWYYNFIFHSMILWIYFYTDNNFSFIIDFAIYFISILTYSFCERIVKESWVLFDSFKRSEQNYRTILDNTSESLIIVNNHFKVDYINKSGIKTIFQNFKLENNIIKNTKIIHFTSPLHKMKLHQSLIKCLKSNEKMKIDILFNFSTQGIDKEDKKQIDESSFYSSKTETHENDIEIEILLNNYQFYQCDVKKIAWKQQSNMILLRIKNHTQKYLEKAINKKQKQYLQYWMEKDKDKSFYTNDSLYDSFYCFPDQESIKAFDIFNFLHLIFNSFFYSVNEEKKNIIINYKNNCNCPIEGMGKYKCLAFILSSLLKYFGFYASDTTLNCDYFLIDVQNEQYVVRIILNCDSFPQDQNNHIHKILNISMQNLVETLKLMNNNETINLILCKQYAKKYFSGDLIHNYKQNETSFEIILILKLNKVKDSSEIEYFSKKKNVEKFHDPQYAWDKNKIMNLENFMKEKLSPLQLNLNLSKSIEIENRKNVSHKIKDICIHLLNEKSNKQKEEMGNLEKINFKISNLEKNFEAIENGSSFNKQDNFMEGQYPEDKRYFNYENNSKNFNKIQSLNVNNEDKIDFQNEENKSLYFGKISASEIMKKSNSDSINSEPGKLCKVDDKPDLISSLNLRGSFSKGKCMEEIKEIPNDKQIDYQKIILDENNGNSIFSFNNEPHQESQLFEEINQKEAISLLYSNHLVSEKKNTHIFQATKKISFGSMKKGRNLVLEEGKIKHCASQNYFSFGIVRIQQSLASLSQQETLKSFCLVRKLSVKPKNSNKKVKKLNNPKVLVVEDNDFQLSTIVNILKNNNIDFEVAKNGIAGLNTYESNMKENLFFTLIFMDLAMPVMNGYLATRNIRSLETLHKCRKTYICGLSSDISEEIKRKCNEAGMDDFMKKPTNAIELTEKVSEISEKILKDMQSSEIINIDN